MNAWEHTRISVPVDRSTDWRPRKRQEKELKRIICKFSIRSKMRNSTQTQSNGIKKNAFASSSQQNQRLLLYHCNPSQLGVDEVSSIIQRAQIASLTRCRDHEWIQLCHRIDLDHRFATRLINAFLNDSAGFIFAMILKR